MRSHSARSDLVAQVLGERAPATDAEVIGRRHLDGPAPLAAAQRRLWILHQLDPESSGSNRPLGLTLIGPLDQRALTETLTEIVRRHEALRTVFPALDGEPVQLVQPPAPVPLRIIHLQGSPADRAAEADRIAASEAARPIDLARGPMLRAVLLRLGPERHVLLLLMHHIVFDGWSQGVLQRELAALYDAFSTGRASPLAEPPIQPADYAEWEQRELADGRLEQHLGYWRERLAPMPLPLALPGDFPEPSATLASHGAPVRFQIPPGLSARLREWSRRERVTPFMTLLSGFQVLLGRYAGQAEFLMAVPVAGRTRPETDGLIGCYMNLMLVRADLSGRPNLRELVERTREQILASFSHEAVPFERLVQELQPPRRPNRWPLFDVLFNLRNLPNSGPGSSSRLRIEPYTLPTRNVEGLALSLEVEDLPGGFECSLAYAGNLFLADTVRRLSDNFVALLDAAVEQPDRPVALLPLVSQAEFRTLVEWNGEPAGYDFRTCVHDLVSARAAERPDEVAVSASAGSLTYRELEHRSNQLAHHLRGLGVAPEVIVGLYLDRSLELVIAMLGVLKAGGAYLPLEPGTPPERLRLLLGGGAVRLVLSAADLLAEVGEAAGAAVVDVGAAALAHHPAVPPLSGVRAHHLAYVVNTSGSTGSPKGVMVTHASLANHLLWRRAFFPLVPSDRVLHTAALAFDDAVWETFAPLVSGATLVLTPPLAHADPARLARLIADERITVACLVPALLQAVVEEPDVVRWKTLRVMETGGEALPAPLQRRFLERSRAELHNGYGPAECTVACSFWKCQSQAEERTVPLGYPIANTQLYVLDRHQQPVPIGVVGELCVGGQGVARGYLHSAGATAGKFIPDPFGPVAGARLYRTGDLVRRRADGALEFLGRADFQLKVRGYRIEPEEVEAAIRAHPAVSDAAVALRENGHGERRLLAFVVLGSAAAPPWRDLRVHLTTRLPDYSVPAGFVPVDALPRTSSGKLDRSRLPVEVPPVSESPYDPPHPGTEERLAEIWGEVLGSARPGRDDDFFGLGGHSLSATQMLARVEAAFGLTLPLRAVFDGPTVAQLARLIDAGRLEGSTRDAPPPAAAAETEVYVLPTSFAQRRLWLLDQIDPNNAFYNIPRAFTLRGPLDLAALEQSLQALVDRHETLRTTIEAVDGVPVQCIRRHWTVALELIDLTRWPAAERVAEARRLANDEAATPFDLSRGPLFRGRLLRLAPDDHLLVLVLHHIVGDGWSLGVLSSELSRVYRSFRSGQRPSLPELPVQYADYALWQEEWLRGEVLAGELGYWRERLAGAPALLQLPTDRPRPPVQSHRGARLRLELPPELATRLRELSQAEGATLYMTLLGAFAVLLQRYSGQSDLVIGSPIAGRTRTELEGLIGFFVNTLALRLDLSGAPSFRTLLRRVRETALGAYTHQELPFERLVEELQPVRTLQHNPIFQVLFQLWRADQDKIQLDGLDVAEISIEHSAAKFDLSLAMVEQGDRLGGSCSFSADLFDRETIAYFLRQFETLLKRIVEAPDAPIETHSLVTDDGLVPDPTQPLPRPEYPALLESFAAQVGAAPGRTAIEAEGRCWTYRELAEGAQQVAGQLAAIGVVPGDVVAIEGPPCFGLIASLLGMLSSGAVMLPIDPHLPAQRRQLMLEQSRAKHLLLVEAGATGRERAAHDSVRVHYVDPVSGRLLEPDGSHVPSATRPGAAPGPDDPAYVFFTSGTTGVPKAVLGVHRSLDHFLAWQRTTFKIGPDDRCAQLVNLSFDPVLRDIFLPLTSGATLCLPPAELPVFQVAAWLARERITLVHVVPSLAQAWLEHLGARERIDSLRWVFLAGEPLTDTLARRVRDATSERCRIVNLYGPTEATMVKCFYVLPPEPLPGIQSIGRTLPQTEALVLDDSGRLCGVGEAGEIVLRTPYLTRGYLNAPDEQRRRFVPNPFRTDPGDGVYRTGDLGRYRWDGTLVWLGRRDHQLKILGVRVEPEEVAAQLRVHPAVRTCAVLGHPEGSTPEILVAYVVTDGRATAAALRAYLAERLPPVMVPSAYVFLPKLPLGPNGKIDRRAVPPPEAAQPSEEPAQAPRGPVEEAVASIWREVLRLDHVSIHADFFALGGHSLRATQVLARVQAAFGVGLPARIMFETPTVAGLAAAIAERLGDDRPPPTAPVLSRAERRWP